VTDDATTERVTSLGHPGRPVLASLGLRDDQEFAVAPDLALGRVSIVHGATAEVIATSADGAEYSATVSFAGTLPSVPVAGDWVGVSTAQIQEVVPRYSALCRPDPSGRDVQVLAANIDIVLLVVPINRGLNVRMLERFAIMGFESGARPIVVLSKIDDADDLDARIEEAEQTVPGVALMTTSSKNGHGIDQLAALLHQGVTAVMLGASGAGKTSLLNVLEGSDEVTRTVSRSGEGRHATTTRKLYRLKSGGVLLDIPGIRLLDLLVGHDGLEETFADITQLAEECRFSDCKHHGDPGCAVEAAVANGELKSRRLENWRLIHEEMALKEQRRLADERAAKRRRSRRAED